MPPKLMPTSDEFISFALQELRSYRGGRYGDRDCDYYAPNFAYKWVQQTGSTEEKQEPVILAIAIETAWELVRRGLLRPGGRTYPDMNAADPARFCVTAAGREWLASAEESHFVLMQAGALSKTLGAFQRRFGDGYQQRSQEALRCRSADAWLATCAMCGAAAESILLSIATAKTGNEMLVLREYKSANGRKKIIDMLVGQAPDHVQRPLRSCISILAYWRDDAAHGRSTSISASEAEEALRLLLIFAQFADERWDELIT